MYALLYQGCTYNLHFGSILGTKKWRIGDVWNKNMANTTGNNWYSPHISDQANVAKNMWVGNTDDISCMFVNRHLSKFQDHIYDIYQIFDQSKIPYYLSYYSMVRWTIMKHKHIAYLTSINQTVDNKRINPLSHNERYILSFSIW